MAPSQEAESRGRSAYCLRGPPRYQGAFSGITGSRHTRRHTLYLTQLLANTPPVTSHLLGAEAGLGRTEGPGRLCGGPLHACGCPPGELCPRPLHRRQTTWDCLSCPLTPLGTQKPQDLGWAVASARVDVRRME